MATASLPDPKGKAPNLCTPQTIVTIYVSPEQPDSSTKNEMTLKETSTDPQQSTTTENLLTFLIHKDFICYYSPFFKAAFGGEFKEGLTQTMTLEADVTAFGIFSNWLYTQKVTDADGQRPGLVALARAWILAERFLTPALQDQVMEHMHARLTGSAAILGFTEFTKIACEHGDGENALTEIAIWWLTWCSLYFDLIANMIPHAMVVKLVKVFKKKHPYNEAVRSRKASEFYVGKDGGAKE